MKKILVPTDYSDAATNALAYATELAKSNNAELILLHVYQIPIPVGDVPIMVITPQELEEENQKRIKNLEKNIVSKTSGKIKTGTIVKAGFTVEEISAVIKEKNVDLVVMGITGEKISEVLIGSHTSSLLRQTQTPVLVVPKDAKFRDVEKIVLAYNYKEKVNTEAVNKIKAFAKLFNAKILVLDVEKPVAAPVYENTTGGELLEKALKDVDHALFYTSAEDISSGINTFADEHKCDWIAMIPHKHNILSRLFNTSNTKKMAFHTHIPLLSIHD
jgi:nucleotide-binding universal stress UspA family protein